MASMSRRLISTLTVAIAVSAIAAVARTADATPAAPAAPAVSPPEPVAAGDVLIANYSYESDLQEWTAVATSPHDSAAACATAVSASTAWAKTGAKSVHLDPVKGCSQPGVESAPVTVSAGSTYTAFVAGNPVHGTVEVGDPLPRRVRHPFADDAVRPRWRRFGHHRKWPRARGHGICIGARRRRR